MEWTNSSDSGYVYHANKKSKTGEGHNCVKPHSQSPSKAASFCGHINTCKWVVIRPSIPIISISSTHLKWSCAKIQRSTVMAQLTLIKMGLFDYFIIYNQLVLGGFSVHVKLLLAICAIWVSSRAQWKTWSLRECPSERSKSSMFWVWSMSITTSHYMVNIIGLVTII